jgi:hypothetical protein
LSETHYTPVQGVVSTDKLWSCEKDL